MRQFRAPFVVIARAMRRDDLMKASDCAIRS